MDTVENAAEEALKQQMLEEAMLEANQFAAERVEACAEFADSARLDGSLETGNEAVHRHMMSAEGGKEHTNTGEHSREVSDSPKLQEPREGIPSANEFAAMRVEQSETENKDWHPGRQPLEATDAVAENIEQLAEEQRLEMATRELQRLEHLQPEKWADADAPTRRALLDEVGRRLMSAYETPAPDALDMKFPEDENGVLCGSYSDEDWRLAINEKLLEQDDVREAIRTYMHEFRHAYQREMVTRWENGFEHLIHDRELAREWREGFDNYTDPNSDYEAYLRNPVERDARSFAERMVNELYGG